jgi:hypothetical protein
MEKEVGTPGGIAGPSTFEFIAGGLLEAGKLPPIGLQALADSFQKGLQGEDGINGGHSY